MNHDKRQRADTLIKLELTENYNKLILFFFFFFIKRKQCGCLMLDANLILLNEQFLYLHNIYRYSERERENRILENGPNDLDEIDNLPLF